MNIILLKFRTKRITSATWPLDHEWSIDKIAIESILKEYQLDSYIIPDSINANNIRAIKKVMVEIYNIVYKLTKIQESKLTEEKIKYHINQRCVDYDTNPSKMIDSILNKNKRKIVIDRIYSTSANQNKLILEPQEIMNKVNTHFQTTALSKVVASPIPEE